MTDSGQSDIVPCLNAEGRVVAYMPGHAPEMVGLCPDPEHLGEFYMPLTEREFRARQIKCPECDQDLLVYRRVAE
jgi:hypothetical protein